MSESELDGVETEITDDEATLTMVEDIADSPNMLTSQPSAVALHQPLL